MQNISLKKFKYAISNAFLTKNRPYLLSRMPTAERIHTQGSPELKKAFGRGCPRPNGYKV